MRPLWSVLITLLFATSTLAAIQLEQVEYHDGDTPLRGYLAYDEAIAEPRPGVVVVPEWWGADDYAQRRARELAELGYVAFVADIYGHGFVTRDPKVAAERAGNAVKNDWPRIRGRLAVEALRKSDRVLPDRIAAIGYCFGGTTVLELARAGLDLRGVVAFHGGLRTQRPAEPGRIQALILVLHGGDDPLVPPDEVANFMTEMLRSRAHFTFVSYPQARHSFTNPRADEVGMDAVRYDRQADKDSWREMSTFLARVLGK